MSSGAFPWRAPKRAAFFAPKPFCMRVVYWHGRLTFLACCGSTSLIWLVGIYVQGPFGAFPHAAISNMFFSPTRLICIRSSRLWTQCALTHSTYSFRQQFLFIARRKGVRKLVLSSCAAQLQPAIRPAKKVDVRVLCIPLRVFMHIAIQNECLGQLVFLPPHKQCYERRNGWSKSIRVTARPTTTRHKCRRGIARQVFINRRQQYKKGVFISFRTPFKMDLNGDVLIFKISKLFKYT